MALPLSCMVPGSARCPLCAAMHSSARRLRRCPGCRRADTAPASLEAAGAGGVNRSGMQGAAEVGATTGDQGTERTRAASRAGQNVSQHRVVTLIPIRKRPAAKVNRRRALLIHSLQSRKIICRQRGLHA
ncbi:hypothetical protein NDU88_002881 [Pleurodeles waltl]|uniref:Uncharacterized protein n=1 Tax=Pleurodeles waltl TaxID=8319 RepID=A0AAV7W3Q0_PLEWA|nr:hypothetical protein NDU88_002881 [Pleurodeles waltl]